MLTVLCLLVVARAQTQKHWTLLMANGAPSPDSTPTAHPAGGPDTVLWCADDTATIVMMSAGAVWQYEHAARRWIYQCQTPRTMPAGIVAHWPATDQALWVLFESGDMWTYAQRTRQWTLIAPANQTTIVMPQGPRVPSWSIPQSNLLCQLGGGRVLCFDVASAAWNVTNTAAPSNASAAALSMDGGVVFVFAAGTLHMLDLGRGTWTEARSAMIGERAGVAMWVDPRDGRVYVEGGRVGSHVYGDVWIYDRVADAWSQEPDRARRPSPRYNAAVCVSRRDGGRAFLYGGGGALNDLWNIGPVTLAVFLDSLNLQTIHSTNVASIISAACSLLLVALLLVAGLVTLMRRCCRCRRKDTFGLGTGFHPMQNMRNKPRGPLLAEGDHDESNSGGSAFDL